jgi:hypothetical protein
MLHAAAEQAPREWWDLWGKLKDAAADLDAAARALEAGREFALARPGLREEYRARVAELQTARSRLTWARDAIRSVFGFFGVELSGLGFVPLIPIAAAGAAVAFVAAQAADTWKLAKKIEEQQRLEARGIAPAEAARIVQSTASAGSMAAAFSGAVGHVALLGALGLGAWFFLKRRG